MALHSEVQIYIAGNPITGFQEFTLHQYLGNHHKFQLVCRMDILEKFIPGGFAQDTKNYLGESLSAQVLPIGNFSGYKELQFIGIVTSINSLKAFSHHGGDMVVIGGHSGTIITDDGPNYASYNDVGLQDILMHTFAGYDKSKLETAFAPKNNAPLHYSVQNNESSWQYAARLAAQYSEWFYYDGKKLIFGKPEDGEATTLTYGHDLQEFSMELNPQPNNFNYFTNDYLVNDQHQKKTSEVPNANGYNGFASEKALKMYSKETNVFINGYNDPQSKSRLDKQVEQQKKAADQKQVILKGTSDNPGVALGKVIKILGEDEHYGSYRITQVTHSAGQNGSYQNNFEAVSAEMDVYPNTNFNAIPRSETQTATVMKNADPDGMGRIKVQFAWQKRFGGISPWLRIVSPHAGGDKGFHFIPENGEEVLVGFEGGNAERPYVMGSLYNGGGKASSFMNPNNDIKAIKTRGGHLIEFKDANGEESITISDKSGNKIFMDTKGSNISITAPANLSINADTIDIKAKHGITIKSEEATIAIDAKQDIGMHSTEAKIKISGKQDVDIRSLEGSAKIKAKIDTNIVGDQKVDVLAGNELKMHGKTTSKLTGGEVHVNKG
ncbi:MAG: type VI secretion system Vgr family protein [Aequorivita sp.]